MYCYYFLILGSTCSTSSKSSQKDMHSTPGGMGNYRNRVNTGTQTSSNNNNHNYNNNDDVDYTQSLLHPSSETFRQWENSDGSIDEELKSVYERY